MKYKHMRRIYPKILLVLLGMLVIAPMMRGAEPEVKVHKDKISVTAPDGQGMVLIKGAAGAIESTGRASLQLENLSTQERIDGEMEGDGGFAVKITAAAGQKVRVWARNEEGKKSYGTFTVPGDSGETAKDKGDTTGSQNLPAPRRPAERRLPKQAEAKNLAVVVMVVDTGTGEVLASGRIAGVPKEGMRDEEQYALSAQRIVSKSITAAKGELQPGVVRENQLGPREKALSQEGSGGAAQKEKKKSETKAVVDKELQPLIDGKKNVGAVVGIVLDGEDYVFGYGCKALYREEVPDGDTVYEIGSITKVFTAALLAKMAQDGLVNLDDAVQKYLPETVRMPRYKQEDKERQITLADLATHRSGLPRLPGNIVPMDLSNPYVNYKVEQLYEFLGGYELQREPGSKYEYSNLGMGLLGHVLARTAGQEYEELVMREICEPLAMMDTRVTLSEQMRGRLAAPYSSEGVGMLRIYMPAGNWGFKVLAGCGALRSTVNDMLKFMRANLYKTGTALHTALETTHQERHKINDTLSMALGWHILRLGGLAEPVIWHNGGTGGYQSFMGFIKEKQMGVIILSNTNNSVDESGIGILLMLEKMTNDETRMTNQ